MSSYRHKSFVSSKKRKLIVKHLTLLREKIEKNSSRFTDRK